MRWFLFFLLWAGAAVAQGPDGTQPGPGQPPPQILWNIPGTWVQPQAFSGASTGTLTTWTNGTGTAFFSFPPTFSTRELLLTNNVSGQNVLALYDPNNAGFSAVTSRGLDVGGLISEKMATGYSNPGSGYIVGTFGGDYTEFSYYPTVGPITFTASASAAIMTVTGTPSGTIQPGMMFTCGVAGCGTQLPTRILPYGTSGTTGTGAAGTYAVTGQSLSFSSTTVTAGQPQSYDIIGTGFQGNGTVATLRRMKFTEDGHIWMYNLAGGVTFNYQGLTGNLCLNCGADPQTSLDVGGNGLFGNTGSRNIDGALGALVVSDSLASYTYHECWIKPGTAGGCFKVLAGSPNLLQVVAKDGGAVVPMAWALDSSKTTNMYGPLVASGLSTSGTIAGAICATSAGIILYESGATGCTISLEELKQSIAPVTDAAGLLMALKPITFAFKDKPETPRLGFGAHQVEGVDKRLSTYDGNGALQGFDPNGVLALTVAVVQQQQVTILWLKIGIVSSLLWLAGLTVVIVRRRQ